MLTRLSVHCALRIVATSSSYGLRKSSAQCASGYSADKRSKIFGARRGAAASRLGFRRDCLRPAGFFFLALVFDTGGDVQFVHQVVQLLFSDVEFLRRRFLVEQARPD